MKRVRDIDRGYASLKKQLEDLGKRPAPRVYVGVLQDKGAEYAPGSDITVAGYASVNEFGSEDGRVPERSFLRSTMDENEAVYQGELDRIVGSMIDDMVSKGPGAGERALQRGLGRLGNRAARDVRTKIRDLRDPENATSTLAAKYPGNNPLVEGGRLRQSISFKVET